MIDLHCHILPGIDDGPKTLKESLEMAWIFEQTGYSHVVATPHAIAGTTWMPKLAEIEDRQAALNQAIKDEGIELKVLPGMEIALDPNMADLLEHGKAQPLAGTSYVLIEPPFQKLPLGWQDAIFDVMSKGFKVMLAHPERCAQLAAKPQLCDQLIESGVYFQVNWDSFLRHHDHTIQKMAIYLAAKGFIHCMATDSHNTTHRNSAQVKITSAKIEKLIGRKNLKIIARDNPIRVLRNETLRPMERQDVQAIVPRKQKWHFWKNNAKGNLQIRPIIADSKLIQ